MTENEREREPERGLEREKEAKREKAQNKRHTMRWIDAFLSQDNAHRTPFEHSNDQIRCRNELVLFQSMKIKRAE